MATTSVTELRAGRKSARLEAAIEVGLDTEITNLARELAGTDGNPKMFRSEAARILIADGIMARRRAKTRASA